MKIAIVILLLIPSFASARSLERTGLHLEVDRPSLPSVFVAPPLLSLEDPPDRYGSENENPLAKLSLRELKAQWKKGNIIGVSGAIPLGIGLGFIGWGGYSVAMSPSEAYIRAVLFIPGVVLLAAGLPFYIWGQSLAIPAGKEFQRRGVKPRDVKGKDVPRRSRD